MKKVLLMFALLLGAMGAKADGVTVAGTTAKQGGAGKIQLKMNITSDYRYRGATLYVTLPEGVSIPNGANAETPASTAGTANAGVQWNGSYKENNTAMYLGFAFAEEIKMEEGVLLEIPIQASADLELGSVLKGQVKDMLFSYMDGSEEHSISFDDVEFDITIVDYDVQLDENSTEMPAVAENVNVNVMRTINADEWSTIVLPFDMDEDQVKAAFGDDVELADFTSWSSEEDDEGDITSIEVGFDDITSIEANHPCLIKVADAVEDFTVYGVSINPDEAVVQVGKKKAERGYFTGTYVAGVKVPNNNIFLSGNKFWYSTGDTEIKGFRAYFEFADVLAGVGEEAKIRFNINGENATRIAGIESANKTLDGVYTVNGQFVGDDVQMNRLPKGVYIVNGKKYLNK